ncbi:hypothetical protein [Paraliomyxa miuraensis]|uniref:hypothetical protein n=1 Tax=Paraliomyxa miuraensis TaxID=376150 RepID=UPI00224E3389|nr:hypothetical protein [Paraliomyxa miuraensis]MCX4239392.1 hypothetical protein [Paraliomyxa miuraensis]MCX4248119.1 hypothetical protein [Paraliomyxa miuraensis]
MDDAISTVREILGEDVKTTDPELGHDWHAELTGRWEALGERVFVHEPRCRATFAEIVRESAVLTVVWAVVESKGNLAAAAIRLGCCRRSIRKLLHEWLKSNPTLIPMPAAVFLHWSKNKGGEA